MKTKIKRIVKCYFYRCTVCTRQGRYWKKHLKGVPIVCDYCGKHFEPL